MDQTKFLRDLKDLGQIRHFSDLKEFIRTHQDFIQKFVLPFFVLLLILGMWIFGGDDHKDVVEESDQSTVQAEDSFDNATNENYDSSTASNIAESGQENAKNGVCNVAGNAYVFVDISGRVKNPGVYEVKAGTRLFQVIEKAGGLCDDADINQLNRAEAVWDGEKVVIQSQNPELNGANLTTGSGQSQELNGQNSSVQQGNGTDSYGRVNINNADEVTLQTIPGIGPSKAQRIVEYRKANGMFQSTEDIKNISGIGDKTYENIKYFLTVG